jgi:RNA polymerase sigma-70 factor, ECF subfamily
MPSSPPEFARGEGAPSPSASMPEAVLVRRARAGEEAAFEALVRPHQDRAYLTALRLTGNRQDAQDSVQEAFLQAWRSLPRFRGDSSFSTWLTRIIINRCLNLSRARRTVGAELDDAAMGQEPGADDLAVGAQRQNAVRKAVLALPFDQRAALVLHTFVGHSHAEVGNILGISETAAKVRVHRARRALVDGLEEWR